MATDDRRSDNGLPPVKADQCLDFCDFHCFSCPYSTTPAQPPPLHLHKSAGPYFGKRDTGCPDERDAAGPRRRDRPGRHRLR